MGYSGSKDYLLVPAFLPTAFVKTKQACRRRNRHEGDSVLLCDERPERCRLC